MHGEGSGSGIRNGKDTVLGCAVAAVGRDDDSIPCVTFGGVPLNVVDGRLGRVDTAVIVSNANLKDERVGREVLGMREMGTSVTGVCVPAMGVIDIEVDKLTSAAQTWPLS